MTFEVRRDDLSGLETKALIRDHMVGMLRNSPRESVHALRLEDLRKPEVTFWSVWRATPLPQHSLCISAKALNYVILLQTIGLIHSAVL